MDITQFLKQNPDIQLSRGTFGSEEHFRKWYESYSSKSPAQILKTEQGVYGTRIYYIYLPSQNTLYVAEVASQEKYVYTTDLAISTAKQVSKNIQELKSQGATYVEISQPKYEIKDDKVYVNVDLKGYKLENITQNTLQQQPQQQNFNLLNYVYESAKYQAMYKGLTYDPEKYAFELTIKEMEKRGYRDIITTTEKEIAKEIMPPIPFIREAWEAGVSIGNILRGVKDVKVIEERKFELVFPEYYFKGTKMEVPSLREITEKIESRPVNFYQEIMSAGTNLAFAFSPWILSRLIPRQEKLPTEIQNAIKENRLVLIETTKIERQLVKNPIFVQTEEFFKTKMAQEIVKKTEEKKLGIVETFAKVPREKYEIRTIHTPFLDRTTVQHFIVKEEMKYKDWFHHPSLGDFAIKKTLPIKYTELSSTQIANVQHNIRKEILQNIHYLGIEKEFKPKKSSTPIIQSTTQTTQTTPQASTYLAQQTEVIIPQRIKVLETKISPIYEEKTLLLPFISTKTLTNLQVKQTTRQAYIPTLKNIQTLSAFNKETSITIPFQTINLNMRTSHKSPEASLTTLKTTTSITTPNITKIVGRGTGSPEQNIPKIPIIKIPLPKLPGLDKRTREIEKPKQVKMYVEKIRFPSLYSLSYNIKIVNNKIAKEIIRPLKL